MYTNRDAYFDQCQINGYPETNEDELVINGRCYTFVETDEEGITWWSDEDGAEFSRDELDKLDLS